MVSLMKKTSSFILSFVLTMGGAYGSSEDLNLAGTVYGSARVNGKALGSSSMSLRHIGEGDKSLADVLPQFQKDKVHEPIDQWIDNRLNRQQENPYSALVFSENLNCPKALVGFDSLPFMGYDPEYSDIIDFLLERGVVERKKEGPHDTYDMIHFNQVKSSKFPSFEDIPFYGVALMHPLFFDDCSEDDFFYILEGSFRSAKLLCKSGYDLPDNKKPKFIMGLLSGQEPNFEAIRNAYIRAEFKEEERPGFRKFYNDQSLLVFHRDLGPDNNIYSGGIFPPLSQRRGPPKGIFND